MLYGKQFIIDFELFFPNQTSLCNLSPWFIILLFALFTAKNSFKCCGSQLIIKNCHDWRLFLWTMSRGHKYFSKCDVKNEFFSASVLAGIPTGDFTTTLKISPLIYTPCPHCVIICRPTLFDFLDSPWIEHCPIFNFLPSFLLIC